MKRFRSGAIDVKVYETKNGTHIAAFRDLQGNRIRIHRATARAAESAARNHIAENCTVGAADERHAAQLLAPYGISVIQAAQKVAQEMTYPRATISELYNAFWEQKKDAVKEYTRRDYRKHLDRRFVRDFGDRLIMSVTTAEITKWHDRIRHSKRTRQNVRATIVTFFRWCRDRGYLPPSPAPTAPEGLSRPGKLGKLKKHYFKPDEMRKLLNAADETLLPALVLAGFAGIRSEELCPVDAEDFGLEWSHIEWKQDRVAVPETISKNQEIRYIPMSANLMEWLSRFKGRTGRIFPCRRLDDKFLKLGKMADVPWRHNALRHSFATYRVAVTQDMGRVSLEMDNSVQMIKRHYWNSVSEDEAKDWWNIFPPEGFVPRPAHRRGRPPRQNPPANPTKAIRLRRSRPKAKPL